MFPNVPAGKRVNKSLLNFIQWKKFKLQNWAIIIIIIIIIVIIIIIIISIIIVIIILIIVSWMSGSSIVPVRGPVENAPPSVSAGVWLIVT